jgi:S1-C subfamily serine protease
MPKRALQWMSCCTLLLAAIAAAEPLDLQRLSASVFRIEASENSGRLHSGSGVMVGADSVITNCHTIRNAQAIHVTGATTRVPARLVRANAERDLCLLSVPGLKGSVVTMGSTTEKRVGEPLVAVGFPAGRSLTVSRGHIEGLFTYQGSGRVVQGSAYFSFGKSGGALFDENGWLIGILTFKCRGGGPYHFSVPVEWVKALMDDGSHAPLAPGDKPFWQYTDERQPVFLRAASLLAQGDCAVLKALAMQWLTLEPENPEAVFVAGRAQLCEWLEKRQRPLLDN